MTTATASPTCSPAYSSQRTRDRPTDVHVTQRIARLAGAELIPWQYELAALLGERLPSGRLAYPRAVVIAPRRAGKSLSLFARGLSSGLAGRRRRAFYAGHRRETAAALLRDEWFPLIDDGPLSRLVAVRRANGSEAMTWRGTGSTFRLLPPNGNAMRSFASHLALLDEAREWSPEQGSDAEAGIFPTQATTNGQVVILSSAGDASSTWLRGWVDRGRQAVAEGRTEGLAYVEFSAPADADPDDEATWRSCHPGLGYHVSIDALRVDADPLTGMSPSRFRAEYLGLWPEAMVDGELVEAWNLDYGSPTLPDPVAFGVEVDERREWSAIVAAGGAGARPVVELVEYRRHGPWLVPRLHDLCARHSPVGVAWDAGGPTNALAPELAELPTRLVPLRTNQVTAAAGRFHDLTLDRRIAHRPDPVLAEAVGAGRRKRTGGAWLFDRREPGAGPLIAATFAVWILADGMLGRPGVN